MKIAVVGGGIAGLAAAWELRQAADVTVFEPGCLGGSIRTTLFGDKPIDEGADAFLTRTPEALELCRDVGIESDLVAPSVGHSMLWSQGRLRPLPDGLVLGVPVRLTSLLRSHILTPLGVARAALDVVLPRQKPPDTLTVRELVAGRFGVQVSDRLVDPLVGSIHAGSTGELGAAEVVPQLVSTAERSRSLLLGLRTTRPLGEGPIFLAPRLGMGSLIEALVGSLQAAGTSFISRTVDAIEPAAEGVLLKPMLEHFDAAIVATPARATAKILRCLSSEITAPLAQLETASVTLVTASFTGVEVPPAANGFLVPRDSGRLMTACSFGSNKWPHWADSGQKVVRLSAGRHGDDRAWHLDDEELAGGLVGELGQALGARLTPVEIRVSRWPHAFPQYLVGHSKRIAAVEDSLEQQMPTVALAGSSYRGVGIPACIASGRRAARLVFKRANVVAG